MTAIPNDEPPILENLEKFDQRPKAYKSRVYVPNTEGAPVCFRRTTSDSQSRSRTSPRGSSSDSRT